MGCPVGLEQVEPQVGLAVVGVVGDEVGEGPGRQPVSSSVSLAAACSGDSPSSMRPAGTSHPQVSVAKRCRHTSRTPRSASTATVPLAPAGARMTWCSKRSPPGISTSVSARFIQWLS